MCCYISHILKSSLFTLQPPPAATPFLCAPQQNFSKSGLYPLPVPHSLSNSIHSGFCPHHSTEIFLVKVPNDHHVTNLLVNSQSSSYFDLQHLWHTWSPHPSWNSFLGFQDSTLLGLLLWLASAFQTSLLVPSSLFLPALSWFFLISSNSEHWHGLECPWALSISTHTPLVISSFLVALIIVYVLMTPTFPSPAPWTLDSHIQLQAQYLRFNMGLRLNLYEEELLILPSTPTFTSSSSHLSKWQLQPSSAWDAILDISLFLSSLFKIDPETSHFLSSPLPPPRSKSPYLSPDLLQ